MGRGSKTRRNGDQTVGRSTSSLGDRGTSKDHRHMLTQSYEAIERRYGRFENAVDQRDLETIRHSNAMQLIASSLRSCYDGETKRLRELKDSIAEVQGVRVLKYCPLCGITSIATHDRYMPASLFPEFAVHPLNLVPCCFTCNSTKGDDWLDEREILSIYMPTQTQSRQKCF
jgi:hypothetical protein